MRNVFSSLISRTSAISSSTLAISALFIEGIHRMKGVGAQQAAPLRRRPRSSCQERRGSGRPPFPYVVASFQRNSLFSTAASSESRVRRDGAQEDGYCQAGRASSPSVLDGDGRNRSTSSRTRAV